MDEKSTAQKQLEKILKKIEVNDETGKKLKAEKRRLTAKISAEERKKRTHNLIEIGGIIYSILGREYQEGDKERLAAFLKSQENRGEFFSKAMNGESERVRAAAPTYPTHKMNRNHFNNVDDVLDDISKNQK